MAHQAQVNPKSARTPDQIQHLTADRSQVEGEEPAADPPGDDPPTLLVHEGETGEAQKRIRRRPDGRWVLPRTDPDDRRPHIASVHQPDGQGDQHDGGYEESERCRYIEAATGRQRLADVAVIER